jgi:hypothetical protein
MSVHAGARQIRLYSWHCSRGSWRAHMALSQFVSMGREVAWRLFDPERALFVLFPDRDLHRNQHPVDSNQLAISQVGRYRVLEKQNMLKIHEGIEERLASSATGFAFQGFWRIPSGETFMLGIASTQRESSGLAHRTAFRMTV